MNIQQAGTFKCALCGDTFKTNKHLVNHKSVHANENRTFKCNKCPNTFNDHYEYSIHQVSHLQYKSVHKCVECGVLKKKIALPMHIMTHYPQRQLACEFCNVHMPVEELKKHVKTHSVLKDLRQCNICNKAIVGWKYETHMANHAIVKNVTCEFCDKVFSSERGRNTHVKIHTGESIEVCDICGLSFVNLKTHRRTHETPTKYECDYCHKVFFVRSVIVDHVRRHVKVDRFKCRYKDCKFFARTKEELCEHQKHVHLNCNVCKRKFPNVRAVKRHVEEVHGGESSEDDEYGD